MNECVHLEIADEECFRKAIQALVNEGMVSINIRAGRVVYSPIKTIDSMSGVSAASETREENHVSFSERNLS